MAKIKSDIHGLYFIYNGTVWRPLIPKKEQSIASARKMSPDCSLSLVGETAKPKGFEDFFIHVSINEINYLWYNHGKKINGLKSDLFYRDFEKEDIEIKALIDSGMSIKEAYSLFWKNFNKI